MQIVKGWVDASGATHERVFDVAGDARTGAGVDPATCEPTGRGAGELCTLWRDPDLRRAERAFYYARVLENPTCRWSTRVCKAAGVDPLSPDCAAQAAAAPPAFADCCRGPTDDATAEPLIQERAWTSPVWYRPEGIAQVRGRVRFGKRARNDTLSLRIRLGASALLDLDRHDLAIRVTDDDEIAAVTVPAGSRRVGARRRAADGARVAVRPRPSGEVLLAVRAARRDLGRADRADHMVTVHVATGDYRAAHTRLWLARGDTLATNPTGRAR